MSWNRLSNPRKALYRVTWMDFDTGYRSLMNALKIFKSHQAATA